MLNDCGTLFFEAFQDPKTDLNFKNLKNLKENPFVTISTGPVLSFRKTSLPIDAETTQTALNSVVLNGLGKELSTVVKRTKIQ